MAQVSQLTIHIKYLESFYFVECNFRDCLESSAADIKKRCKAAEDRFYVNKIVLNYLSRFSNECEYEDKELSFSDEIRRAHILDIHAHSKPLFGELNFPTRTATSQILRHLQTWRGNTSPGKKPTSGI